MIAVLADDLSGAAELAGAAFRRGLSAEVQVGFDPDSPADVICVDMDTRSRSAPDAARIAGETGRRVAAANPDWVYKKCDSVLRGHVLAELRAAMSALGKTKAMLVPANPARGRMVRDGHLWVDGRPLQQTAFALDPEHPRVTGRIADLLRGDLNGVAAPDAESAADLARHAAAVDGAILAAGGVEFFEALLAKARPLPESEKNRPSAGPAAAGGGQSSPVTLVVCGSAASWPTRRRQADTRKIPSFGLPHQPAEIARALRANGCVLLGIGSGEATHGLAPSALVKVLARTSAEVLRTQTVERLLLEGGATAAAVVQELGWTRLVAGTPAPFGIGALRPLGTSIPALLIKPGSYDWPKELWI